MGEEAKPTGPLAGINIVPDDPHGAMFHAFVSLIKVLHRKGVVHIDEVVREMGDTIDFQRKHHAPPEGYRHFLEYYESLKAIADAYAENESRGQ